MDALTVLLGVAASILSQVIKRKGGGALENILGAVGLAYGGALGLGEVGMALDPVQMVFSSLVSHGVLSSTQPYQKLKLGAVDALFSGLGKAVGSVSSDEAKP